MNNIQQENRKQALAWWRDLTEAQKIEMWQDWKLSLEPGDTKAVWSFNMITNSDTIIEQIYLHISSHF